MGIPTFAGTNEENTIAGIGNNIAAVAEIECKSLAGSWGLRKEDAQRIVTASAELLFGQAFVLKEGERRAIFERDGIDFKVAGEVDKEDLLGRSESAEINGSMSFEGVVRKNGGIDAVVQSVETDGRRSGAGKR